MRLACLLTGGPDRRIVALDGEVYTFEDSLHGGPAVLGKRGDILAAQPGPHSLFWPAYSCWVAQGRRICDAGFCIWHPEPTAIAMPFGNRNFKLVGQVIQNDRCCLIAERSAAVEANKNQREDEPR